ncbi:MAG TPA: DUF4230 domain-containing protein [Candidatus Limnocylindria bacterium]|nr:DUF4230 domain-containing protein [Candidatus Limnocylindria bacterium]
MKNRLAIALVCVALIVGLGIAAVLALAIVRRSSAPRFASTPSVVLQIQSLSELVTVKYVIEKVIFAESPKTTTIDQLLPGRDDKLILLAHGVVKAGVDLSKLKAEDVEVNGQNIRINVPKAVVTDGYLDENATQVLDRRTGLLRTYDQKLEQQARQEALAQIIRAARHNGIEREANERVQQQLASFLKSLGYQEVQVQTRSAK